MQCLKTQQQLNLEDLEARRAALKKQKLVAVTPESRARIDAELQKVKSRLNYWRRRDRALAYSRSRWHASEEVRQRDRELQAAKRRKDPEAFNAKRRAKYAESPELRARVRREHARRQEKHRDKLRQKASAYQKANREARNAYKRAWAKRRRQTHPGFAVACRLRARILTALRDGGYGVKADKFWNLTGCTPQELVNHIASKFLPGMTWENRNLWHIDHIIPCAAFDLTDPEQQRKCFHYTNLQPLWGVDNQTKGARQAA